MFDLQSLAGNYAVTVTGEGGQGPFAALGILCFDGLGSVSGVLLENRAGHRYGERVTERIVVSTTYSADERGLSTFISPDCTEAAAFLVVRAAEERGPNIVASEVGLIFRDLDSSTGALRAGVMTRLPDGAIFSSASLAGRYVGFATGLGGQSITAGFGLVTYDGKGGFTERNVANIQADNFRTRRFVLGTDKGPYTVDADGMGTVQGGAVRFVITRAQVRDNFALAVEYSFFVNDLVPATGTHFTGTVKRIGD